MLTLYPKEADRWLYIWPPWIGKRSGKGESPTSLQVPTGNSRRKERKADLPELPAGKRSGKGESPTPPQVPTGNSRGKGRKADVPEFPLGSARGKGKARLPPKFPPGTHGERGGRPTSPSFPLGSARGKGKAPSSHREALEFPPGSARLPTGRRSSSHREALEFPPRSARGKGKATEFPVGSAWGKGKARLPPPQSSQRELGGKRGEQPEFSIPGGQTKGRMSVGTTVDVLGRTRATLIETASPSASAEGSGQPRQPRSCWG